MNQRLLTSPSAMRLLRGFSLLEVMIAVGIVAILTAVAMPSYTGYIDRSRRGDGMDLLLRVAAAQQSYYLANKTYTANMSDLTTDRLSDAGHYGAFVSQANSSKFTIIASPTAAGTTGTQADDGIFVYSSTGRKSWDCNGDNSLSCTWQDAASK